MPAEQSLFTAVETIKVNMPLVGICCHRPFGVIQCVLAEFLQISGVLLSNTGGFFHVGPC